MDRRPELRVSDQDRQAAADRLRAALGEGRLDLFEYDSRLEKAYAAVTYGDLDRLFDDLPAPDPAGHAVPPRQVPLAARSVPAEPALTTRMPTALKVLWTIWLSVVFINLTVWLLVSIGDQGMAYFWPIWLAVPGAALFGVTVGVTGIRTERAERAQRARGARGIERADLRAERRADRRRRHHR